MSTLTPTQDAEVTFISGVDAAGRMAPTSFWTWSGNNPATYDADSDEAKWGAPVAGAGAVITYAFDAAANWTGTEEAAFVATLDLWSDVANVSFRATDQASAEVVLSRATDGTASGGIEHLYRGAVGTAQLGSAVDAGVSIDTSTAGFGPLGASFSDYGGYPWTTLIHEVGHVLGLGHSGPYDDGLTPGSTPKFTPDDTRAWSVMSYNQPSYYSGGDDPAAGFAWGASAGDDGNYYADTPTTPMILDIAAVQRLYGAATTTPLSGGQTFGFHCNISGDTAAFYDFTLNTHPIVTLWDAGIGNTLDVSGFSTSSTVHLTDGSFSSVAGLTDNLSIALGARIDALVGGPASDTVFANDDGDTLTGGGGGDLLYGGAGQDTFRDTVADMAGDDLGFGPGDRIEVSDASVSTLTFHAGTPAAATLTLDGSSTLGGVSSGVGRFSEAAAPGGGVDIFVSAHDATLQDVSGDGHSDVIWRQAGGAFTISDMQVNITGAPLHAGAYANASVSADWTLQDSFDWNGDGYADLLWRNVGGAFTIWTSDGAGGFAQNAVSNTTVNPSWTLAGVGDFDGDGRDDIIWRNGSTFTVWRSDGVTDAGAADPYAGASLLPNRAPAGFIVNTVIDNSVDPQWKVDAVADFNGDGKADILWRNSLDGAFTVWSSTGAGFTPNTYMNATVALGWTLQGAADFNGDGRADLLWRDGAGDFTVWTSNGAGFTQNTYGDFGGVDTHWQVAQIGDFNGDGKADILWRNAEAGVYTVWTSNGSGFTENAFEGAMSGDWSAQADHFKLG